MRLLKDRLEFLVWIGSVAVGITVFVYSTFTTQAALEDKEKNITQYVDLKHDNVQVELRSINKNLEEIKEELRRIRK